MSGSKADALITANIQEGLQSILPVGPLPPGLEQRTNPSEAVHCGCTSLDHVKKPPPPHIYLTHGD